MFVSKLYLETVTRRCIVIIADSGALHLLNGLVECQSVSVCKFRDTDQAVVLCVDQGRHQTKIADWNLDGK